MIKTYKIKGVRVSAEVLKIIRELYDYQEMSKAQIEKVNQLYK